MPWDKRTCVLSTGSFPSTSILRKKKIHRTKYGTCSCGDDEHHRDLFQFNMEVVGPHLKDSKQPITGYKVCWNAENIWECKLPRVLTGLDKRVSFEELGTVYRAQKVLFDGTYWYSRLISPDGKDRQIKHGRAGVAVLRLLCGKSTYSGPERVDQLVNERITASAVKKLQNLLATVDGMLMQLVLCFPLDKEIQSWSFMDRVAHSLISCLLPDYFGKDPERVTAYEKVKKMRKCIKEVGFNPIGRFDLLEVPQEISFFKPILKRMGRQSPWNGYMVTTLSQTRAAGVPPASVHEKTMAKITAVLKEPSDISVFNGIRALIRPAIDEIHQEVLLRNDGVERTQRFFSRCVSAAKISLNDSGEFFTKSEDGGKLEAARQVLKGLDSIELIDLATGQFTGERLVRNETNQGHMLFMWACHQFHDRNCVYDKNVMSVRISLVAELGKYRAITVSHLAHAVLLHVLSHVLLEYLKDIPSSASGVGAANHAWNFFKRLSHKNPCANFLFNEGDVYLFSTDWEQATDYCDHYVATSLLNNLSVVMGIPNWYRQTCVFALCAPRQVETVNRDDKTLEMFLSTRGVLMGDPVTKVILHTYHLVVRTAVKQLIRKIDLPQ